MGDTTDPALAIDIGGTKLAGAIVDSTGRVVGSGRVPTPTGLDEDGLWRTLEALLDKLVADAGDPDRVGVGVGCGGPMVWPAGEVSPLNIPGWRGFPLRERLRAKYSGLPVRVHNDAVCVAVGEHWRGAGRGHPNMLGMVVSTGVGGGLVLHDRIIDGASGNAGHIGHVVVDPEGPPCVCGGRGCLEAIARGPGLVAWARGEGWRPGQEDATGVELTEDARRNHPVALAALRRGGRALGIAIASATHLCDLEVVVIGGGLANASTLLFEPLEEALHAHSRMRFASGLQVVPAGFGHTAGLVGAAALIFAGDRYWNAD
jgi:glucokinase